MLSLVLDFLWGSCKRRWGSTIVALRATDSRAEAVPNDKYMFANSLRNLFPTWLFGGIKQLVLHCTVVTLSCKVFWPFPDVESWVVASYPSVSKIVGGPQFVHCCWSRRAVFIDCPRNNGIKSAACLDILWNFPLFRSAGCIASPRAGDAIHPALRKRVWFTRLVFKSGPTLRNLLTRAKDPLPINKQSNVVYEVPCTCGKVYIGETKRRLETRMKEY